jgi:hypothetical protein
VGDYLTSIDNPSGSVSPGSPPTGTGSGTSGLIGTPSYRLVAVYINDIKYCIPMITDKTVELCSSGEES